MQTQGSGLNKKYCCYPQNHLQSQKKDFLKSDYWISVLKLILGAHT